MKDNKLLSNDYTNFNSAILLAAQDTATKERTKNQGWFHHSELILLPEIQHRYHLLNHLKSKDPSEDTTSIKEELKTSQNFISDYVSLLKPHGSPTEQHSSKTCDSHQKTCGKVWRY